VPTAEPRCQWHCCSASQRTKMGPLLLLLVVMVATAVAVGSGGSPRHSVPASSTPGQQVQASLDVAIARGAHVFTFPAGDVLFAAPAPGVQSGTEPASLLVRGARDLLLQGAADGSTRLLFGLGGGLRMHECENSTLSRVMVDYAPFVPFMQAQITGAAPHRAAPAVPSTSARALLPPAVLAPCSANPAGFARPLPPCPTGWWQDGSVCMQGCPLSSQGRSPVGRCLCGGPSPNSGCLQGLRCEGGQCTAPGDGGGWEQRWNLNTPWPGYVSNHPNAGSLRCLNVGYCSGQDLLWDGCYHSGPTCAGPSNFSIFEFFLEPAPGNASHHQLRSAFGGCVRAMATPASAGAGATPSGDGGETTALALVPCDHHDDAQLWAYLPTLQLRNGASDGMHGDAGCLSMLMAPPSPPPTPPAPATPPMRYTLELSPRSLPPTWPDIAHGVLWDGRTNHSIHEFVPSPGGARHLHERQWEWNTSIPGATVGDWVTFAGRDNFTIVLANSSACSVEDVVILTAPGFAITEIDGEGGHAYRRVRIGSHGRAGGYLVGANADAFHSVDVGHGPLLEDCDFS